MNPKIGFVGIGAIVIDMSSGVPAETAAIAGRLAGQKVAMIDAPVSGGVRKAVTGELAIMVGGDKNVAAEAGPILKAMGKSVIWAAAQADLGTGRDHTELARFAAKTAGVSLK